MGIIESGVNLEDRVKDLEIRNAVANLRNAATSALAKYDLADQVIDDFQTTAGLHTAFSGYTAAHATGYIQGVENLPDSNTVFLISGSGGGHGTPIITSNLGEVSGTQYTGDWSIYGDPEFRTNVKKFSGIGQHTSSMLFDNVGDYMESAADPEDGWVAGDWTMEGWVRLVNADPGGIGIFGYGDIGPSPGSWASIGFSFYWAGADGLTAKINIASGHNTQEAQPSGGVPSSELAADGTWYHLALISSATTGGNAGTHNRQRIYVNGTMEYEGTEYSNSINTSSTHAFKINGYIYPDYASPANTSYVYMNDLRFSSVARYGIAGTTNNFDVPTDTLENGGGGGMAAGNMVAVSLDTATAASPAPVPIKGDLVIMYEDTTGIADVNTDIIGYVSRDSGSTWATATLVSEGALGTSKIVAHHDIDVSGHGSARTMRYKITTHNQGAKVTKITGVALGWH